jgi:hypothetical protein
MIPHSVCRPCFAPDVPSGSRLSLQLVKSAGIILRMDGVCQKQQTLLDEK